MSAPQLDLVAIAMILCWLSCILVVDFIKTSSTYNRCLIKSPTKNAHFFKKNKYPLSLLTIQNGRQLTLKKTPPISFGY